VALGSAGIDDALVLHYACFHTDKYQKILIVRPENVARRAIIREWMLFLREKWQAGDQAAVFVFKVVEKHDFRSRGDRQRRIMTWLISRACRGEVPVVTFV
jgi:hypothetical protein